LPALPHRPRRRLFDERGGGRPLGTDRPRDIEFEGDAEVGRRIADNLAYVI